MPRLCSTRAMKLAGSLAAADGPTAPMAAAAAIPSTLETDI
jgi:hypothetical protein